MEIIKNALLVLAAIKRMLLAIYCFAVRYVSTTVETRYLAAAHPCDRI